MMSDRHRTPTEGWYHPQTSDRSTIGQRRVEDLQRQIASMENNMKEKSALMHKLSRLQEVEDEKREIQDKVLERNSRNNSPRLLQSEMDRLYGRESHLDRNESPGKDRNTIETVIQHRTKEFSAKQQETALKAKYLDKERHRLQEARERVQEQRRMLQNMSPAGKNLFSFHQDKLYMSYQPYHIFENKEERIRDSFVLPIQEHTFPSDHWKFRLKFVPVPLPEEDDTLVKYSRQIVKEDSDEVDEALDAFRRLTEKQKGPKNKNTNIKIKYVPELMSQNVMNSKKKSYGQKSKYQNLYRNRRKFRVMGDNDFRDTFKMTALHDEAYRLPEQRSNFVDKTVVGDDNTFLRRHYTRPRKQDTMYAPKHKMKVKFNPVPTYGQTVKYK